MWIQPSHAPRESASPRGERAVKPPEAFVSVLTVLVAHAAVTWFLAGLIWVVQLVHYPLFDHVERERFVSFEQAHSRRITWIVAPAMLLELVTGVWLPWTLGPGPERGLLLIGAALIAAFWLSTFFVQVPCHRRLARGYDSDAHRRLVRSNWFRTAVSSLRAAIVTWLVLEHLARGD